MYQKIKLNWNTKMPNLPDLTDLAITENLDYCKTVFEARRVRRNVDRERRGVDGCVY